jgi:hypothetical protein
MMQHIWFNTLFFMETNKFKANFSLNKNKHLEPKYQVKKRMKKDKKCLIKIKKLKMYEIL